MRSSTLQASQPQNDLLLQALTAQASVPVHSASRRNPPNNSRARTSHGPSISCFLGTHEQHDPHSSCRRTSYRSRLDNLRNNPSSLASTLDGESNLYPRPGGALSRPVLAASWDQRQPATQNLEQLVGDFEATIDNSKPVSACRSSKTCFLYIAFDAFAMWARLLLLLLLLGCLGAL